jgi:hypothetical protein
VHYTVLPVEFQVNSPPRKTEDRASAVPEAHASPPDGPPPTYPANDANDKNPIAVTPSRIIPVFGGNAKAYSTVFGKIYCGSSDTYKSQPEDNPPGVAIDADGNYNFDKLLVLPFCRKTRKTPSISDTSGDSEYTLVLWFQKTVAAHGGSTAPTYDLAKVEFYVDESSI